jgi:hypothetical protein
MVGNLKKPKQKQQKKKGDPKKFNPVAPVAKPPQFFVKYKGTDKLIMPRQPMMPGMSPY